MLCDFCKLQNSAVLIEEKVPLLSPEKGAGMIEEFAKDWISERTDRPDHLEEYELEPERVRAVEVFVEDLKSVVKRTKNGDSRSG